MPIQKAPTVGHIEACPSKFLSNPVATLAEIPEAPEESQDVGQSGTRYKRSSLPPSSRNSVPLFPQSQQPAIRTPAAIAALGTEFREVQVNLADICCAELVDDDLFEWELALWGPRGSAYEGGVFRFLLHFPPTYPNEPVHLRCATPMFHCNIDHNGTVCMGLEMGSPTQGRNVDESASSLSKFAKPIRTFSRGSTMPLPRAAPVPHRDSTTSVSNVIQGLLSLLMLPLPDNALVPDVARLFVADRRKHDRIAMEWTRRHAL